MNDKSYLSIAELKSVLVSLKEQKLSMKETQKGVNNVIESSASCLSVSGLNYSAISDSLNNTFNNTDKYLEELINVLENNVIKNYSELIMVIRKTFDKNFADKISSLLEIK